MTSLEEFAEARKSGRYHPETERNTAPKPSPIDEEKPAEVRTYTNLDKEIKDIKAWLFTLSAIVLVMLIIMIAEG